MKIEDVNIKDASNLLKIYEPYVKNTAITFEYDVPTLKEFEDRIKTISSKFPYIKLIDNDETIGYAYAHAFQSREAYKFDVEVSIYLDENQRGKGYGKVLYTELLKRLKQMDIVNVYACITRPNKESKYVSDASYNFHLRCGFKLVGTFKKCGYKFDEWFDMVWMEKQI